MKASYIDDLFLLGLRAFGFPEGVREYQFCERRFRFDLAYPLYQVALEREGGTLAGRSRHTTGLGYQHDIGKYNTAACQGWLVVRADAAMMADGRAVEWLARALASRGLRVGTELDTDDVARGGRHG